MDKTVNVSDLVTVQTIANRLCRVRSAVTVWTLKYPNFPDPLPIENCHQNLYVWPEVVSWYQRKFGPLPLT